jgi:hypothetical protein
MQQVGECLPANISALFVLCTMYLIISKMYFCVHACWLFVVHGSLFIYFML